VSPLLVILGVYLGVCAAVWILSLLTHDHSWVDRIWSIIPVVYLWIFAGAAGLADPRLDLMATLGTLWGIRLTFNFARKGGYSGVEDYRWAILRNRMPRWQFEMFNFFFIVLYQNLILALITFPGFTAYLAWQRGGTPLGVLDIGVGLLFLLFLVGETVADQQQWRFQARKRAAIDSGKPTERFLTTGLWHFSRHPNFFSEQAQWWTMFLFGCIAAGSILQWTVIGAALLTLLFVGSTIFTESITKSKYPEYAEYQARTSAVIPLPARAPREPAKA
jgi:steroid 5-alpha reductase family enzyme